MLLSAGMSLYIQNTKYVSLNKGTVFGKTNVYQFKSYRIALPFIVASLDRCVGSCNKFYKSIWYEKQIKWNNSIDKACFNWI